MRFAGRAILLVMLLTALSVDAGEIERKIAAAGSDLTALAVIVEGDEIPWSALLYLNQEYGAELSILIVHPSPLFRLDRRSTPDNLFHIIRAGKPSEMPDTGFADTVLAQLCSDHMYPDIALYRDRPISQQSIAGRIIDRIARVSTADTLALAPLGMTIVEKNIAVADLILSDEEFLNRYRVESASLDTLLEPYGPSAYHPQKFRRFSVLANDKNMTAGAAGLLSNLERFRLPDLLAARMADGPEKNNLLGRLGKFRSYIRAADSRHLGDGERLNLILSAYKEISSVVESMTAPTSRLYATGAPARARAIQKRAWGALQEAIGLEFSGELTTRGTPDGPVTKLSITASVSGPMPVGLAFLKLVRSEGLPVAVDSIGRTILPHQQFTREYLIDLGRFGLDSLPADAYSFAVDATIGGMTLSLPVPYTPAGESAVSVAFLPGYAFLQPFTEGQTASLAQTFDWQLEISKPEEQEFRGRLEIQVPDGIVVGSFNKNIVIPAGLSRAYFDIHLAAGFSIGADLRRVRALLSVDGEKAAETSADVKVIRCAISEKRKIGFLADPDGRLEDFLRMAQASFQPLTANSLVRAPLDAYGMIIIGPDASANYSELRAVGDRLRQYVRNGGEVLILGQSEGWPADIFASSIHPARTRGFKQARISGADHPLLKFPYTIDIGRLIVDLDDNSPAFPAVISAGSPIVAAGELGAYLQVSKEGDGHIIYCGLPLLELAAKLNAEAVHLLANLLNFGYEK